MYRKACILIVSCYMSLHGSDQPKAGGIDITELLSEESLATFKINPQQVTGGITGQKERRVVRQILNTYHDIVQTHLRKSNIKPIVLHGHSGSIRSVTIHGTNVVSDSNDGTIRIWNLEDGAFIQSYQGYMSSTNATCIYNDTILTGAHDGTIHIWDLDTNQLLYVLQEHNRRITALDIKENYVVSGSDDHKVCIWDLSPFNLRYQSLYTLSIEQILFLACALKAENKNESIDLSEYPKLKPIYETIGPEMQQELLDRGLITGIE